MSLKNYVQEHSFLSAKECEALCKDVRRLQKDWLPLVYSENQARMYCLGTPLYEYACARRTDLYEKHASKNNVRLRKEFSPIYNKLVDRLQEILKTDVRLKNQAGLPGFHVFVDGEMEEFKRFHVDDGHVIAGWAEKRVPSQSLTITVPLKIPRYGSGLTVKDVTVATALKMSPEAFRRKLEKLPSSHFPYKLGRIYLHSGLKYHQFGLPKKTAKGDERITLQCHALKTNEAWEVYF